MIEIRTDADAEPAHPDGPHDPDQTRAIASGIDEAFRLLNYATMPGNDGLTYPSDVYSVLGELASGVAKLPQALQQMHAFVAAEVSKGRARENTHYGRYQGDATAAATALLGAVAQASTAATQLQSLLDEAQSTVRGLESTRNEDQDDE